MTVRGCQGPVEQQRLLEQHLVEEVAWGDHEEPPTAWASGDWSAEVRNGELVDIRFDGAAVLRSVRAVARDQDWGTLSTSVVGSTEMDAGFAVDLALTGAGVALGGRLTVTVADSSLSVHLAISAETPFERNRLGLVVLHPPTLAGEALEVVSPDGSGISTTFPTRIAPHQPAVDISGLRWQTPDVRVSLDLTGDVFEMEDQRNWTDASFKTYSTPLSLPFPVRIQPGDRIEQSLMLSCSRVAPRRHPVETPPVTLIERGFAAPAIGVLASSGTPLIDPIGSVLLVELDARGQWRGPLDRAVDGAAGRALDIRIVCADPADLDAVLDAVAAVQPERLGVFSASTHVSEPALWHALLDGAVRCGIRSELVGGARSHFTEFNRTHDRLPGTIPSITVSMTPQMHATERRQLVESIAMQALVSAETVRLAAGRPVHLGPVTLRPRFNAVATSTRPAVAEPDPRQSSRAAAAWLAASHAALAVDGVASITWFDEAGPRGYGDVAGEYPTAEVARVLASWSGYPSLTASGPLPPDVWITGVHRRDHVELLVANLAPTPASVHLDRAGTIHLVEVEPLDWTCLRLPT